VVVAVAGEIDMGTAEALAGAVHDAIDGGAAEVWADLTKVGFMDSTGVHVLVDARARATELNRRLRVVCPPGEPRRLLEMLGLTDPLGVAASLADAQRAW
jgi:anti-sigma B factor antagonist